MCRFDILTTIFTFFYLIFILGKLKCGGTLRADTGIITTPNYPSNYPNSIVCIWLITTDSTKYIELTMLDFDIEPYRKCKVDTLEIKDGDNKNSPMIGSFPLVFRLYITQAQRVFCAYTVNGQLSAKVLIKVL